jgi:drug/metabolite transporter (DMT)-like permease
MTSSSVILLTLSSFSAAGGQLLFKIGSHGKVQLLDFFNIQIFLAFLLYGIGIIIWIYTLSFEKLVNVYAFTGLTFALVYLGGVFLLDETLNKLSFTGILLVCSGIYLMVAYGHE